MSLKDKLASFVADKVVDTVAPKDKADSAINFVLNKIGKAYGKKSASEYIQQIQSNYIIIKAKSYSVGTVVGLFAGKTPDLNDYLGRYQILDASGAIKYKSDAEDTILDREILDMYDAQGQKIGSIKEHLISVGVPLFEKDVRKCSVFVGKEKIAVLKRYKSFGDLEIEVLEGDVAIKYNESEPISINYKKRLIAKLHKVPLNLVDGYVDKYVMECGDPADEIIAVLIATAFDLINP